jgi:predicted ester cyclase
VFGKEANPMSTSEENKETVRHLAELQNSRNFDAIDEIMLPGFVRHSRATPGVSVTSREAFKEFLRQDLVTFPDSRIELERLIAEGDFVAVYATYTATQEGPMGPFPASGNPVDLKFMAQFRFEDGKIAELWVEWDNLDILTQAGHFTPPEMDQQ